MPASAVWPAGSFLRRVLPAVCLDALLIGSHFIGIIGIHIGDRLIYTFQNRVGVGQLGKDGFEDFHKYGSFLFINL